MYAPSKHLAPLPGEANGDLCRRLAASIDKDDLIRALIHHLHKTRRRHEKNLPAWAMVAAATGNGSGVSCGICAIYGLHSSTAAAFSPPPTPPGIAGEE